MVESEFSALAASLESAWNSGDGDAFARAFAADADFIHILGGYGHGRDAIAAAHRALFAGIYKDSIVRYTVEKVRPLGPAAVVLLSQHLAYRAGDAMLEMSCRPTAIVIREGEGWQIALMQNTRIANAGSTENEATLAARHPFRAST